MFKGNFINKIKHIHFIGIKGVAMASFAILAKKKGIKVTGSDLKETFITDDILKKFAIEWKTGFSGKNIEGNPDLVVVTGAHGGMTNPESIAAQKKGLNVLMHGQALGKIMEGYFQISIAGCHGKTTTSAMIAYLLSSENISPSYLIGCADIPSLESPGLLGDSKYFIAEADEYMTDPKNDKTPRFLWQKPNILVITNIEYDHPDAYKNIDEVKKAFLMLVDKMPKDGTIVCCADDENVKSLFKYIDRKIITYGFSSNNDWKIKNVKFQNGKTTFDLINNEKIINDIKIIIPGEHNCLNASASIIVGLKLGLKELNIKKHLLYFSGTKRRFEFIKEKNGIKLYDDYAHHPTEIKATLKSAKDNFSSSRIICIFQPHTYSRTKILINEFSKSFKNADKVIVTDIYSSAREKNNQSISGKILANKINAYTKNALFLKSKKEVLDYIKSNTLKNDVIITMGAGNIFLWHEEIINVLP